MTNTPTPNAVKSIASTANPRELPADVVQAIGTMSDAALSRQSGCEYKAIRAERIRLGIERFSPLKTRAQAKGQVQVKTAPTENQLTEALPAEVEALLGLVPDLQISRQTGIPARTLRNERQRRGIPKAARGKPVPPGVANCLGKMCDAEVSERFGLPVGEVTYLRRRAGLRGAHRRAIPARLYKALGKATDVAVASQFGKTAKWVRKLRTKLGIPAFIPYRPTAEAEAAIKTNPEIIALLGTVSDRELMKRYGGGNYLYRSMREERGIPAFNAVDPMEKQRWESQRQEAIALLGKVSDSELSRRYGGVPARYTYFRNQRNIPPYNPKAEPQT